VGSAGLLLLALKLAVGRGILEVGMVPKLLALLGRGPKSLGCEAPLVGN